MEDKEKLLVRITPKGVMAVSLEVYKKGTEEAEKELNRVHDDLVKALGDHSGIFAIDGKLTWVSIDIEPPKKPFWQKIKDYISFFYN